MYRFSEGVVTLAGLEKRCSESGWEEKSWKQLNSVSLGSSERKESKITRFAKS